MATAAEQQALTQITRGTPMGELLRRYWHPVAAASELETRGTRKVRLLGEDLALFRDTNGRWGLVEERCPHRGASLAYGVCDAEGLRCPYHGWKFDREGRCLETPAEPAGSTLKERVCVPAYQAEELGGLVFAYLGPKPAPLLPRWDALAAPGGLRDIGQATVPCHWLQIMENSVDPTHTEWLHGHHLGAVRARGGRAAPTHYARRHVKIGFDPFPYGIIKRRVLEGGSEDDDDWKVGHPLLFPTGLAVGEQGRRRIQFRVPIDETHTWHLWYAHHTFDEGVAVPAQASVPLYDVPWRDERGQLLVDTVDGADVMTWVTQGAVADRTREQLASSDKGIVMYRKMLFEQMDVVARGGDPLGVLRDPAENQLIELPRERNKFRGGRDFLLQSLAMGHGRASPLYAEVERLLSAKPRA